MPFLGQGLDIHVTFLYQIIGRIETWGVDAILLSSHVCALINLIEGIPSLNLIFSHLRESSNAAPILNVGELFGGGNEFDYQTLPGRILHSGMVDGRWMIFINGSWHISP